VLKYEHFRINIVVAAYPAFVYVVSRAGRQVDLISYFRRVLNIVCFLLGNSPASEFYMPTFRNTLSIPSSWAGRYEE